MTFQTSDFKGKYFLELLNNNYLLIKLIYIKNCMQLKSIRHSNSLCVRVTRAIMNYVLTGEYHLIFFSKKNFSYPCGHYLIELRHYILHKYRRYNNYWNSNRKSFNYFIMFLEFNSEAFSFLCLLYISSYCVATIVCYCILYNKLSI